MALKSPPMRNPIAGSLHLQGPSFNSRFCLCPLSQTTEPKKNPCISRPGCCKPVMGSSLFIPGRKEVPSFLCHPGERAVAGVHALTSRVGSRTAGPAWSPLWMYSFPRRTSAAPSIQAPSPASLLSCYLRGCPLHLGPPLSSLCEALKVRDDAGTCRQPGAPTKTTTPGSRPAFLGNQGWGRSL